MMIPFNRPAVTGHEEQYVLSAINHGGLSGDGAYTKKCEKWLESHTKAYKALLTPSCTHALELSAVLLDIREGDEVIMPSYTFTSTANAFALRGARIVFVDIRPDTMNMNEQLIEAAITERTKAVVVVHYAGVACDMAQVMAVADQYQLYVVEDAAQGVMSTYMDRPLGGIGHLGCYSFHETKNYTSGEGGALLVNDPSLADRAEIIREKGTNRKQFLRGQVDKYSWVDIGSSFLPSDLNAAYLYAQLEHAEAINEQRLGHWERYNEALQDLNRDQTIELPYIPPECVHNAHMFYVKTADLAERTALMSHLKAHDITASFHYVPLHTAAAGKKYGVLSGEDLHTTKESQRLLRLPMYYGLADQDIEYVADVVHQFYNYS